jgi:hypothetical protein
MIRIDETTTIEAPIQRCFDLSRSVEVHLLRNVHSGEQALAINGLTSGLQGLADRVTWRAKHFGFWHNLTNEVTAINSPTYFQVTMNKGIFRSMQADHYFRTLPSSATETTEMTEMTDHFRIASPPPILGLLAEKLFLRRYMLALIRERNAVIKQLAESSDWKFYIPMEAKGKTTPS